MRRSWIFPEALVPSSLAPGCPVTLAARHWSNSRDHRPEEKETATTGCAESLCVSLGLFCCRKCGSRSLYRLMADAAGTMRVVAAEAAKNDEVNDDNGGCDSLGDGQRQGSKPQFPGLCLSLRGRLGISGRRSFGRRRMDIRQGSGLQTTAQSSDA